MDHRLHRALLLGIGLLFVCHVASYGVVEPDEFPPAILMNDPRPQPPFTQEVEVSFLPVMQIQVVGQEMEAILTIRNLSPGSVCLPHGWGPAVGFLADLQIEVDHEFALQYGINIWDAECSIGAPIRSLLPNKTAHAIINLESYLTFTKPISPPVPVTWRLTLRKGQEKCGHFILHLQIPKDPLDEVMERHRQEQDEFLSTVEIQLPPAQ